MEAHTPEPVYRYEKAEQLLRLQTDRPHALRQAILAYDRGGRKAASRSSQRAVARGVVRALRGQHRR